MTRSCLGFKPAKGDLLNNFIKDDDEASIKERIKKIKDHKLCYVYRMFDMSLPMVTLTVYNNGQFMYSKETELDLNYSWDTSEKPFLEYMTGTRSYTVLDSGMDYIQRVDEGRRINAWTKAPALQVVEESNSFQVVASREGVKKKTLEGQKECQVSLRTKIVSDVPQPPELTPSVIIYLIFDFN